MTSTRPVPIRALSLSALALTGAAGAMLWWPDILLSEQLLAAVLALIPAFLLAYYRGWARISVLLAIGMVTLGALRVLTLLFGLSFDTFPLVLLLVVPYVAIALGAGWFGEVRRAAADLRATQLQLIQSEKLEAMGRLAAGVAHEVKNPLMTILTGVKVLKNRLSAADESTQDLLRDMVDAVGRADAIIGGLLSYSRQEGLNASRTSLNDVIERSLILVKHDLDQRRIGVVRHLDHALPPLALDALKIQQVLIDLFTNAAYAMDRDGTLTVRTMGATRPRRTKADSWRPRLRGAIERVAIVQVDDTGTGVPAAVIDRVFDPFFTTKPTGMGTGLGLSVSRQIIEMHGGTITIENRPSGGARVTLTLALDQPDQEEHRDEHTSLAG